MLTPDESTPGIDMGVFPSNRGESPLNPGTPALHELFSF